MSKKFDTDTDTVQCTFMNLVFHVGIDELRSRNYKVVITTSETK